MTLAALQLRALLANDCAKIEHLSAQLVGVDGVIDALPADDPHRGAMLTRLGATIRRAQRRRNALETLSPAAPHLATPAREVTCPPPAAQPANFS